MYDDSWGLCVVLMNGVTRSGREWRWLLHRASQSSPSSGMLTVASPMGLRPALDRISGSWWVTVCPTCLLHVQTNGQIIQHRNVTGMASIVSEKMRRLFVDFLNSAVKPAETSRQSVCGCAEISINWILQSVTKLKTKLYAPINLFCS
jgi:hypothetical protein